MEGMASLLLIGLAACLLGWSIYTRVRNLERSFEVEPKPSFLAKAIQETVAVAGGIYVALTALAAFLKTQVPSVTLWGFTFDPLAALALILAILQPFIMKPAE